MIIDLIILILLAFGFLIGFKRGFTRQLVSCLGMVLILILSFILKNPVSVFMYNHFPFFSFKGLSALNILLYEVIAFVIIFSILSIVLKILMMVTNVFEKMLNMTILLGIPSKILGGILGLLENYIIIFVVLYFINLPMFNMNLKETKLANFMLSNTPILSNVCNDSIKVIEDFDKLKDQYDGIENTSELNNESLKLFTKYNIISQDNIDNLIKSGKL